MTILGALLGVVWLAVLVGWLWLQAQTSGTRRLSSSSNSPVSSPWFSAGILFASIAVAVVGYLLGQVTGVIVAGAVTGGFLGLYAGIRSQIQTERRRRAGQQEASLSGPLANSEVPSGQV